MKILAQLWYDLEEVSCDNSMISKMINKHVQCTYSNNTFLNFPMISSSCNKNKITANFCLNFAENVERNDQKLFM